MRALTLLALALPAVLLAQTPQTTPVAKPVKSGSGSSLKAQVGALNTAFAEGMMNGDAAVMADLYTQDAELLFFKGSTFKGREAIQEFMTGFFKGNRVKAMTVVSEESHMMGGSVLDIGHYEMTTVADGKEESSKGRYMQVLKKGKDGKWRLFRDCPLPD